MRRTFTPLVQIGLTTKLNRMAVVLSYALVYFVAGIEDLMKYPHYREESFILAFTMLIVSGALLNFSMFLCTTVNSALTTLLVGVIKSALTNIIGK